MSPNQRPRPSASTPWLISLLLSIASFTGCAASKPSPPIALRPPALLFFAGRPSIPQPISTAPNGGAIYDPHELADYLSSLWNRGESAADAACGYQSWADGLPGK